MNVDVSRSEKLKAVFGAVALAAVVALLAPPIAEAATKAVRIKGPVKIKDSNNNVIESKAIPTMGLLQAEGSDGALSVRTFGGGGGFLGAGDCTPGQNPGAGDFLPNSVSVSNAIVTGIIITGTGTVTATSAAVGEGQVPLLRFQVNAQHPNEFVGLGNGLTATAPLTFTGSGGGSCNFVVLGQ